MPTPSQQAPFHGWRVVAAAFVIATFGWGLGFYGPPVYLHTVAATRGWSVALVSVAVTVHFLIGAVAVANLPRLHARFGLPAVTKGGAVLLAAGLTGWALAAEPWQLFIAASLSGVGWICLGAAAINAMIAPWFAVRRPAALSMAYNGASVGGIVFSPLWVALIAALGFPMAAVLIGAIAVLVIWLLADLVLASTPEALGQSPDGGRSLTPSASPPVQPDVQPFGAISPWADARFLSLTAAMALGLFAQVGLIAHLVSLLVPALGLERAGLAAGLATVAAIVGRTAVGWLMPPGADRRLVLALSYGVQIAGAALFLMAGGQDPVLLVAGVVLVGAGIGNATSLPPLIAQAEFAKADVGRVVALIVAIGQATYAFAPALFGALRSLDPGTAQPLVYIAAAAVQALAIALLLGGRVYRVRQEVARR